MKPGNRRKCKSTRSLDYAVLGQLRAALAALIVELEEPKRTLPWHKLPFRAWRRAARETTSHAARTHRPPREAAHTRLRPIA